MLSFQNLFKFCVKKGPFPNEWKKGNVVPFHKTEISKGQETTDLFNSLKYVENKLNERLIHNNLFEFFIKNDLISSS